MELVAICTTNIPYDFENYCPQLSHPLFLALVLLLWCLFQQEDTVHEVSTIFCKLVEVVSETGSFNR